MGFGCSSQCMLDFQSKEDVVINCSPFKEVVVLQHIPILVALSFNDFPLSRISPLPVSKDRRLEKAVWTCRIRMDRQLPQILPVSRKGKYLTVLLFRLPEYDRHSLSDPVLKLVPYRHSIRQVYNQFMENKKICAFLLENPTFLYRYPGKTYTIIDCKKGKNENPEETNDECDKLSERTG